jgi:hypothetical protein
VLRCRDHPSTSGLGAGLPALPDTPVVVAALGGAIAPASGAPDPRIASALNAIRYR